MKKKLHSFGLDPENLARLLAIGSGTAAAQAKLQSRYSKEELLKLRLSESILPDRSALGQASESIVNIYDIMGTLAGEEIGNLLLLPETDIYILRKIKRYAKNQMRNAANNNEREASGIIYYASIASALVYHQKKITKQDYKNLYHSLSLLSMKKWIVPSIQRLLRNACKACQNHLDE